MNNTLKVTLAATAFAAFAGIAAPAAAHASVYGSIDDHSGAALAAELADDGYTATESDAASVAVSVCDVRASGTTEVGLRHRLENKFPVDEVVDVVLGAEFHFCPQYDIGLQQQSPTV